MTLEKEHLDPCQKKEWVSIREYISKVTVMDGKQRERLVHEAVKQVHSIVICLIVSLVLNRGTSVYAHRAGSVCESPACSSCGVGLEPLPSSCSLDQITGDFFSWRRYLWPSSLSKRSRDDVQSYRWIVSKKFLYSQLFLVHKCNK